jgi:hypothetical protein
MVLFQVVRGEDGLKIWCTPVNRQSCTQNMGTSCRLEGGRGLATVRIKAACYEILYRESELVGCCEDNASRESIQDGKFLDYLIDYWPLKKFAQWA